MLRYLRLVVVPGLGALHENISIGFEPRRIIQGANAKPDKLGASPDLHIQRRAAVAAEDADNVVAAVGLRNVAFWFALKDAEAGTGNASGGNVRSPTLALAVAAMAA